jgi:hypothetical protein
VFFLSLSVYGALKHAVLSAQAASCLIPMGVTSENVAEKFGINREAQDKVALRSHSRAAAAQATGRFKDEIVPVHTKVPHLPLPLIFYSALVFNQLAFDVGLYILTVGPWHQPHMRWHSLCECSRQKQRKRGLISSIPPRIVGSLCIEG